MNSGEGGFLQEERDGADLYILQYNKGRFAVPDEHLVKADAIEIRVGQGAESSAGYVIQPNEIGDELRAHLELGANQSLVMPATFPDWKTGGDLKKLVDELRAKTGGVPIGVKICAGAIEQDLDRAVGAGVDFITLDGGEGGTAYSPETTINNMGIPTVYAIPRAQRFLTRKKVRDRITLIASGGFKHAGDILKGLALGADACYIGQAAYVALTYAQWDKLSADETPLDLLVYTGKRVNDLDVELAARELANFIKACTAEMQILARCMGHRSLQNVGTADLVALTPVIAQATGVAPAYLTQ